MKVFVYATKYGRGGGIAKELFRDTSEAARVHSSLHVKSVPYGLLVYLFCDKELGTIVCSTIGVRCVGLRNGRHELSYPCKRPNFSIY